MDQLELGGIGVLVFIDHDVLKSLLARRQHLGMLLKKAEREQQQIIKINRIAGAQSAFVAR